MRLGRSIAPDRRMCIFPLAKWRPGCQLERERIDRPGWKTNSRAPRPTTIGHSTRTIEQFVGLLREHGIELLVDVRRFPGSRRHPHFGSAALGAYLAEAGVGFGHAVELG